MNGKASNKPSNFNLSKRQKHISIKVSVVYRFSGGPEKYSSQIREQ